MSTLGLVLVSILTVLPAQGQRTAQGALTQAALTQAILGHWTGVLEYRDYSEPATSTKRVQLPTWLYIRTQPEGLRFEYVYDDGPGKTVTSLPTVVIDVAERTYKVIATDAVAEAYAISGIETLRDGRGTLLLTGSGTDNGKPAEIRTTFIVHRNLLSWLEEVRPVGSQGRFAFRHRYTFTRAEPPPPAGHGEGK